MSESKSKCTTCGGYVQRKASEPRTCLQCQQWLAEMNEVEWQAAEKTMADALNEKNRATFLSYDMELRRGLIVQAIEDGVLYWTVRGSARRELTKV